MIIIYDVSFNFKSGYFDSYGKFLNCIELIILISDSLDATDDILVGTIFIC